MADGDDRKSALIAQLAAQRARLSRHAECVKESVNMGARLKANFAGNRAAWFGGAALLGVVLTRLGPGRTVKVKVKGESTAAKAAVGAGILLPILKIAFDLARPALVSMLTARVTGFAARGETRRRSEPR